MRVVTESPPALAGELPRARVAVRLALLTRGDGRSAAEWLATPHPRLVGRMPLEVARASVTGLGEVAMRLLAGPPGAAD